MVGEYGQKNYFNRKEGESSDAYQIMLPQSLNPLAANGHPHFYVTPIGLRTVECYWMKSTQIIPTAQRV
jgi:hypothetical protein